MKWRVPVQPKINVTVKGNDTGDLRLAAEKITEEIAQIKGTQNVENSLVSDVKTLELSIRPKEALANGFSTMQVAQSIQPFLSKQKIGEVGEGGEKRGISNFK